MKQCFEKFYYDYEKEINLKINQLIESIVNNDNFSSKNNKQQKNLSKQTITSQSLNQILYGPPGTGKTYRTIKNR